MHTLFLLSEYGSLNGTLFARGAANTPSADCPECFDIVETVEHILFECPLYTNLRYPELTNENIRNNLSKLIETRELYTKFSIFGGLAIPHRGSMIQLRSFSPETI